MCQHIFLYIKKLVAYKEEEEEEEEEDLYCCVTIRLRIWTAMYYRDVRSLTRKQMFIPIALFEEKLIYIYKTCTYKTIFFVPDHQIFDCGYFFPSFLGSSGIDSTCVCKHPADVGFWVRQVVDRSQWHHANHTCASGAQVWHHLTQSAAGASGATAETDLPAERQKQTHPHITEVTHY